MLDNYITKTLDLIAKYKKIIEINTGNLRYGKDLFFDETLIRKIYDRDIPLLLGSDAHSPDKIAQGFNTIIGILKKIGVNYLAHLNKRRVFFIDIT